METITNGNVEATFQHLLELEPKLISSMVPANDQEEKNLFLAGEHRLPEHTYPNLAIDDEKLEAIRQIGDAILADPRLDPKHEVVYREFVEGYLRKTRLMQHAYRTKAASTDEERENAKRDFMELNVELYGAPDRETYTSLFQEKLHVIKQKNLSSIAADIHEELLALVPAQYVEQGATSERYRPSSETIEWMQSAVNTLYGSMLEHVPDKESFNVDEVRDIFDTILRKEFGEAAEGWRIDVEPATSINVKGPEKRVVIPEDRGELPREIVEQLVVHELGVHVMRAITGGQTDIGPLQTGLNEYYDAEEGLGKIMEQALRGNFIEAGVDHYITAGLATFDDKDFRDAYEIKWRLGLLDMLTDEEEVTEAIVANARKVAYTGVMRIYRGTDELPWYKDLAYYNGSVETWKFLEKIKGDDFRLTLLLMGKTNVSDEHLRVLLESKSV